MLHKVALKVDKSGTAWPEGVVFALSAAGPIMEKSSQTPQLCCVYKEKGADLQDASNKQGSSCTVCLTASKPCNPLYVTSNTSDHGNVVPAVAYSDKVSCIFTHIHVSALMVLVLYLPPDKLLNSLTRDHLQLSATSTGHIIVSFIKDCEILGIREHKIHLQGIMNELCI